MSLSSLPGALHCASDSVGGDLRTWWGEALNEVQVLFLTLILCKIHYGGACRVLAQHTYTILRSAFGESIELCVRHQSVNCAAEAIDKRCNFHSKTLIEIWIICLDPVSANSEKGGWPSEWRNINHVVLRRWHVLGSYKNIARHSDEQPLFHDRWCRFDQPEIWAWEGGF